MLKSPLLFAVSVLVTLFSWTGTARAVENMEGLSFDLPPSTAITTELKNAPINAVDVAMARPAEPLPPLVDVSVKKVPLPEQAVKPVVEPIVETVAVPPAEPEAASSSAASSSIGVQFLENSIELPSAETEERTANLSDGLGFLAYEGGGASSPMENRANAEQAELAAAELTYDAMGLDDWIFEGGSKSLVAHTVGSAEGTRHWDGKRTKAYYGHEDPGNGVWNLGTFSYQHEATSPEDADERQLKRLKYQGVQLEQLAEQEGVKLSLFEKLNGLDLANQAPIAALGKGGYIERLAQARRLSLASEEAIVWARTRSYLDPDTRAWNAPGLGNNLHSISKDQERRMSAISKALRAYDQVGQQTLALGQLGEQPDMGKSERVASRFEPAGSSDIGIGFELSDSDIRQSISDADSVIQEVALEDSVIQETALADSAVENSAVQEVALADSALEETLSAETLDIETLDIETVDTETVDIEIDEQLLPSADEVASYVAGLDSSEVVTFPSPAETAVVTPAASDIISSADADSQEAIDEPSGAEQTEVAVAGDELVAVSNERTPVLPLLSETAADTAADVTATVDVAAAAEPEAEASVESETELSIPAPMRSEADRGDRPTPNRSWWRTEDKIVRKK